MNAFFHLIKYDVIVIAYHYNTKDFYCQSKKVFILFFIL